MRKSGMLDTVLVRNASRSELTELERLFSDWFSIITNRDELRRTSQIVAILNCQHAARADRVYSNEIVDLNGDVSPLMYDIWSEQKWIDPMTHMSGRLNCNLLVAKEKLALLARLAAESGRKCDCQFTHHPLYASIATIQMNLEPQLTVGGLAERLCVNVSTVNRWFQRAGSIAPERFFGYVRVCIVMHRLQRENVSAKRVALELGFSSPATMQRLIRRLCNMTSGELRVVDAQKRLQKEVMTELSRPYQFRAYLPD